MSKRKKPVSSGHDQGKSKKDPTRLSEGVSSIPRTWVLKDKEQNDFKNFAAARGTVMSRIKPTYIPDQLLGLESECASLTALLKRTVVQGQNNAGILIGPRGTGKSACLAYVLRNLKQTYVPQGITFLEIYLNGFVSRDDTSAMREICRQLSSEMDMEFDHVAGASKSFTFYLGFLNRALLRCKELSIAVIFVLDEMDLFAHEHVSQTLLYNLSDLLQSNQAQMAVIGLTSRVTAYNLLEKRIKSRTSHRLFFFNQIPNYKLLKLLLYNTLAPDPLLDENDLKALSSSSSSSSTSLATSQEYIEHYSEAIKIVLSDSSINSKLRFHFALGRDLRWFFLLFTAALSSLSAEEPLPQPCHFLSAIALLSPDLTLQVLTPCSVLELSLVVGMLHLIRRRTYPCNFNLIFAEYTTFERQEESAVVDNFTKGVALKAFERLLDYGVFVFHGAANTLVSTEKNYRPVSLSLSADTVRESLPKIRPELPSWLVHWSTVRMVK